MALQALAPYYGSQNALSVGISPGEISRTVDRALARLASVMKENCTFCSYGAENTESTAQVIIALCSLGIDPRTDERFMRGGKNIVDGMQSFLLPGSVYRHSPRSRQCLRISHCTKRTISSAGCMFFQSLKPDIACTTKILINAKR